LLTVLSKQGNIMPDSTKDTSGPDGTWYFSIGPSAANLRENNELDKGDTEPAYRYTVIIEGSVGWLVSSIGNTDFIDSVAWTPGGRLLEFRRVGPDYWQWHRGNITHGVYVGRFAHEGGSGSKPTISRYTQFASGWNSTYLDTDIVPRVYEVLVGNDAHGRLRLDRSSAGTKSHVGRLKIFQGPHGEEFEYDVEVLSWNGTYLEFVKHGDTPDTYDSVVEHYRAVTAGRLLVGTVDVAGNEPETLRWKAARAEVLGHGLTPRPEGELQAWQIRTRAQIKSLLMAGNPAPVTATPPALSKPPGLSSGQRSNYPVGRDDAPAINPADYSLTKLTFDLEIPDPYGTGTTKRHFKAYLSMPSGDPADPPDVKYPGVIALNGHHGSAWTCMCPCSTLYWYGDAFARRGYAVLAVNVGHRTHSEFYDDDYSSDNTPAGDYDCSDGQDGDGPDNHPQPPIIAPEMGQSDWADDGERTWNVLQAYEWLQEQPYIDPERIMVTGLSLGGRIATYIGALEPRLIAVLPAGFSPDLGLRHNLGRPSDDSDHRCNFWDRADLREYIDVSDLHALVAPRTLIVQTGRKDDTYSVFRPRIGQSTVDAYFAGDKQVARRTRAAYAQSPSSFIHYLHYDKHRYHVGVTLPAETGAERFVHQPVDVEPPAAEPWNVFWQASPQTADQGTTLFDYLP
jgi:dienelactone hydrolase